jgi:CheY-like chemotaxis protein
MPNGGTLTIQTQNSVLTWDEIDPNSELTPGNYVLLTVADSGIGMNKETRDKIFEPFFTTKEEGKGTGLGLATVYGVVMQNKGGIRCVSEPNKGTKFRILFPTVAQDIVPAVDEKHGALPQGAETILLVEDEKIVRDLSRKILERQGYVVLIARDGHEALSICSDYPNQIDLLLTDLIMPDISGKKLSEQIKELRSDIKILFMSGYNEEVIDQHGVLKEGVNFIHKPFTVEGLANKVYEILKS